MFSSVVMLVFNPYVGRCVWQSLFHTLRNCLTRASWLAADGLHMNHCGTCFWSASASVLGHQISWLS